MRTVDAQVLHYDSLTAETRLGLKLRCSGTAELLDWILRSEVNHEDKCIVRLRKSVGNVRNTPGL